MEDLGRIAVRVFFTYVFMLALLRLSGKRTVAEGTPLDFVVALILGDMLDNVFWGTASAASLVAGGGAVLTAHLLLSMAEFASKPVRRLLLGDSCLVVADGEVEERGCRAERLSSDELTMDLRLMGEDDMREVRRMTLEPSGAPGLLKHPWAREAQKSDLGRLTTDD